MTLLLGTESIGAERETVAHNKAFGFRVKALHTGTVEEIKWRTAKSTAPSQSEAYLAIYSDKERTSSVYEPGNLLAEAKFGPVSMSKETWYGKAITYAITFETYYWLILFSPQASGTNTLAYEPTLGEESRYLSKTYEKLENNMEWGANLEFRFSFAALGTIASSGGRMLSMLV